MSDEEEESMSEGFSASEEEWKPTKDVRGGESSDDDDSEFDDSPLAGGSSGGGTAGITKKKEPKGRSAIKQAAKKRKPTGQSLRTKLFNKYRPPPKTFPSPRSAGNNSPSASTSRTASKNAKTPNESGEHHDDSSSGSSVEDYLVNPDELDLQSSFFNVSDRTGAKDVRKSKSASPPPVFDCNAGVGNLSDSGSEDNNESSAEEHSTAKAKAFDFHNLLEKANSLERAKETIAKRAAEEKTASSLETRMAAMDVNSLLALGEKQDPSSVEDKTKNGPQKLSKTKSTRVKRHTKTRPTSAVVAGDTDDSDWEEVADDDVAHSKHLGDDSTVGHNLEIRVELPSKHRRKEDKKKEDVELALRRKLNRDLKERQLLLHKTSLLCLFARSHFYNRLLNNMALMKATLKLLPTKNAYPPERGTELKYFQSMVTWFKTAITLESQAMYPEKTGIKKKRIKRELLEQIKQKSARCREDFVFMFVILLRGMGIQCRLVVNLQPLSLRPAQSELLTIKLKRDGGEDDGKEDEKVKAKKAKVESEKEDSGEKAKEVRLKASKKLEKDDAKGKNQMESKEAGVKTKKDNESRKGRNEKEMKLGTDDDHKVGQLELKKAKIEPKKGDSVEKAKKVISTRGAKNIEQKVNIETEQVDPKKEKVEDETEKGTRGLPKWGTEKVEKQDGYKSDENESKKPKVEAKKDEATKIGPKGRPIRATKKIVKEDGNNFGEGESKKPKSDPKKEAKTETEKKGRLTRGTKRVENSTQDQKGAQIEDDNEKNQNESEDKEKKGNSNKKGLKIVLKDMKNLQKEAGDKKDHPKKADLFEKEKIISTNNQNQNNPKRSKSKSPINPVKISTDFLRTRQRDLLEKETLDTINQNQNKLRRSKSKSPINPVKISTDFLHHPSLMSTRVLRTRQKSNQTEGPQAGASKETLKIPQLDGADDTDVKTSKSKKSRVQLKKLQTSRSQEESDEDFEPSPSKKPKKAPVTSKTNRLVLSPDESNSQDCEEKEAKRKMNPIDLWAEVWSDVEEQWMCVDLFRGKIHSVEAIRRAASSSLAYVFAFQNDASVKDVTARYCPHWAATLRKDRVEKSWLDEAIAPYLGQRTNRDIREDQELRRIHEEKPMPTAISDFKNHPLYALERHLLKFQAIYPPEPPTLGFVRGEAIYSRDCVHTLHSRDIWLKQARTVKLGEQPYKIVKARPKWDRLTQTVIKDQPLEIFGYWQTQDYEPPTAENGIVPRNAYGNVELFKECMLPKKTIHLRLPGLNRICKKLNIDCANAVVGFDFHQGACHPMYDGFVVCEEFHDQVVAAWHQDQEDQDRKEQEKYEARVYGNWKKLIRGLLIRERLKKKYNF